MTKFFRMAFAKEILQKIVREHSWHGVAGDKLRQQYYGKIKLRVLQDPDSLTEDLCHKILLEIGFDLEGPPTYRRGAEIF